MANSGDRVIYILRYLYEYTDDEHYATVHQLLDHLEKLGIHSHRQTVISDIGELVQLGFDIVCVKSTQNRYYINDRKFSMPELTLLVDAVAASRTITKEQSSILISKIASLSSSYNSVKLLKMAERGRTKSENPDIMEIIDTINRGIETKKQLSYKYFDINENLEQKLRYGGKSIRISPYDLVWVDDRYYLIGFSVKHKKEISLRVDRMTDVKLTKDICVPVPDGYDVNKYLKQVFKMYDGSTQTVELKCFTKDVINSVIDKFGADIAIAPTESDDYSLITVNVSVSKTFYSWVFQFVKDIEIVSPGTVREEFKRLCQEVLKQYR